MVYVVLVLLLCSASIDALTPSLSHSRSTRRIGQGGGSSWKTTRPVDDKASILRTHRDKTR